VRPNRYALARSLAVPLQPDELALHVSDIPLCVKVCAPDAQRQHVVGGSQGENMRRMARMRRGGGRRVIPSDGLRARRRRSVAPRRFLSQSFIDATVCGKPAIARAAVAGPLVSFAAPSPSRVEVCKRLSTGSSTRSTVAQSRRRMPVRP